MNWKPLTFPLLLLTACSDRNAPSTALFEQVIEADKAVTQAVCRDITTGVDRLPAKYQLDADQDSFFQDYKILEKNGYLTIRQTKATDVFGTAVDAWEVALTPKWATDFDTPSDGERCVGTWRAQKVNSFTPPAEVNGVRVSAVTVTGTQSYTAWASDPELRAVFNLPPLKTTTEKTYTLVLKNVGWEVAGVSE
ncbi:hypothetical protein E7T06_11400 [Deinococcus sp. Arct2-2]|uniref:hypothetical protein n=1 Tax=Deinococcus sp. Arct2-2 TaxID=2568653 RepID=UPI0010A52194|nr:hypothetical protein [Deinococcus sp. Arct2-2]THF69611.1 hypothetical protein E7T06_11400 [Deinococcus sp. Arct2-2]